MGCSSSDWGKDTKKKEDPRNKNEDADYFACEGPLRASRQGLLRVTNAPDAP